ncbi:hypothetical protein [Streptomyces enissocaesilis]|uniref:Secreted protein n=1 Tax=Streptomyces enissocaesilis TaxID=332589 RepID=A0ABN3XNU8_9ACTN
MKTMASGLNPKKLCTVGASTVPLSAALVGGTATPAAAHTLTGAARAGCEWPSGTVSTLDSRTVLDPAGARNGTLYLPWSGTYGENCLVTPTTAGHGIDQSMSARPGIRGAGSHTDSGTYSHFAAVSRNAAGKCVNFGGSIPGSSAGRDSCGNCG